MVSSVDSDSASECPVSTHSATLVLRHYFQLFVIVSLSSIEQCNVSTQTMVVHPQSFQMIYNIAAFISILVAVNGKVIVKDGIV